MQDRPVSVELTESEALKIVNSLYTYARHAHAEDGQVNAYGQDLIDLADRVDESREADTSEQAQE